MYSLDDQILKEVNSHEHGHIFVYNDFAALANPTAIRVAMHRLVKRGVLERIIPGLFVKPTVSKLLNKTITPSLDKVAEAIARKDNAKITPTGVFALYALGLSTQIPLNLVYLTDGKARKIKVGKSIIAFKHASPKKLALKGKISKLAILAMSEIGKHNLTALEIKRIAQALKQEKIDDLKHDLQLAPQWVATTINEALKNE